MSTDEPVELDPEVLADPVEGVEDDTTIEAEVIPRDTGRSLAKVDPFRRYLADIRRYPVLTREEEQELARRYRDTGDREALFRLVTANLMMVVHVARSFRRAARNLLDLIQEGNIGLLQAIERFDPDVGVRLPTYAGWWVRAYMVKFLLDNVRLVRVGTTNARRKLLRNLNKEKARLEAQGFDVGPRLLADHFGVSEADVQDVQQALSGRDVSLDAPLGDDETRSREEVFAAPGDDLRIDEEVARKELQERAQEAIGRFREDLSDRDRAILDERVLSDDPLTLQALGDRFGTSREAVRQVEARLVKRLKEFLLDELGDLGHVRVGPS
jgi:RNA polymerase sigma-32 factor